MGNKAQQEPQGAEHMTFISTGISEQQYVKNTECNKRHGVLQYLCVMGGGGGKEKETMRPEVQVLCTDFISL
jgi:hypothetical protein